MTRLRRIDQLIEAFAAQRPIRTGSLVVTLFGDCIAEHGGSVWLGSVIKALEPLGLNHRLVRTAVFRLVRDNWLESEQLGRRSYYRFTDFGNRLYRESARRIYSRRQPAWNGCWTLVFYSRLDEPARVELQKELKWLGYGQLGSLCMAHPNVEETAIEETLQELGVADRVIVMRGETLGFSSRKALHTLVHETWQLAEQGERYRAFLDKYRPLLDALRKAKRLDGEQCFQLRTLMIHEYRRVFLADADLPDELMREDWPRNAAAALAADIYELVREPSLAYVEETFESADGSLPPPSASFYQRFAE